MPSYSRISAVALLSRLALATLSLLSPRAAGVESHHAAQLIHAKADTAKKTPPPAPIVVPLGNELYQAQRGDSIPSVARKYLKKTKYLTSRELGEAMRTANGNRQGTFLKSGEQILGGHAVLAVGYDNEERVFIVRNSWGEGWGDAGYFYMPFAYLLDDNLSDDLWTIRLIAS